MLKTKNIKMIDVQDWDDLVTKTYGKPYSFQQQMGCQERGIFDLTVSDSDDYDDSTASDHIPEVINGEDMEVQFSVWLARDPKAPLNPTKKELESNAYYWGKTKQDEEQYKNDKSHIELFWERNFYPSIEMVANDLCKKKLIEPGEYKINIDW